MIDINKLKQGDLLTYHYTNCAHTLHETVFVDHYKDGLYFYDETDMDTIRICEDEIKDSILRHVTSWKRDGVELIKQEEEKPLYVFCPIDKVDSDFLIEYEPLNKHGNVTGNQTASHIEEMNIGVRFGEYTFIGYSSSKADDFNLFTSPVRLWKTSMVCKFAVFVLTSKLHVGGGE